MALHHSEWLDAAKNVPLGQKRRVYHGAEYTPALDVYNNADSWSCYCHRCKEGGKIYKQHLAREQDIAPTFRKYLNRKALITLTELAQKHPDKYKRMVVLLQDKHVSTLIMRAYSPMYNTEDDRLVFRFDGVDIGRDCTGLSGTKWYKYYNDDSKSYVYLQGKNKFDGREPVVLCEDLFSCIKITYYTGCSTLCLLGTRFTDETLGFIRSRALYPIIATDGDGAGYDAKRLIHNRLSLFDIPFSELDVPSGLDPKDLRPVELNKLVHGIINRG